MEDRFMFFAGVVAVVVIVLATLLGRIDRRSRRERRACAWDRKRHPASSSSSSRRSSMSSSPNVEQKEEDDDGPGEGEEAVRSDLADSLGRAPIDAEEVRGHLAAAARIGLDWRTVFEQAVADELRERPFRAPSMPPANRVAPRA